MVSARSARTDHSLHYPEVNGISPASNTGTKEKMVKRNFIVVLILIMASESSRVVEPLPLPPGVIGLNPATDAGTWKEKMLKNIIKV